MYQVLIAEDEPAALEHLYNVIQNKCPGFQVAGTAEDGKNALEQIEYLRPDVLITDVRMPVMDGIFLIKRVKEKYPDILTVIVSGFQEFDYAQTALRYGVCDYILKPVKPSVLQECMYGLEKRLDEYYYGLRNRMIQEMCAGTSPSPGQFGRIFSEKEYYVALLRRNCLPRRFAEFRGVEIFSGKEEQMMVYGRDEMEALYICPSSLLLYNSFYQFMMHVLEKERKNSAFYTLVLRGRPIQAEQLPEMIRQFYQALNYRLVIGKDQIIRLEDESREEEKDYQASDNASLDRLEYLVKERNQQEIPGEIARCFARWTEEDYTQLATEEKVREMFSLFRRADLLKEPVAMCEYFIDEAFYYAENMQKLAENIQQILCRNILEEGRTGKIDTPEFFHKIEEYMQEHLSEQLSPQKVCGVFGISQAYLSRLFRKYSTSSFSKRLTILRVERAQQLMRENSELFIKDIAARVGYGDQFYFSRIFRSITGISPTEYMEELKSEE